MAIKAGGDQAVFNMINGLQYYCNIHFVYPTSTYTIDNQLKNHWSKVSFHPYIKERNCQFFLSRIAINFLNKYHLGGSDATFLQSASNYFTPHFLNFISNTISTIRPDIVQTEFYNYQDLVYLLPNGVKKVFIQHEIRYVVNSQRLGENISFEKLFVYNKLKAEELLAMNSYDAIFTLTDNDKTELIANGVSKPIFPSPAGISLPDHRNDCWFNNKLIFVGGSGHSPNVDGIKWFIENAWNIIQSKHPEIILNIIGEWNPNLAKQVTNGCSNINFKGFVPDLQDEYNGSIAIVPILRGSGMRMKIMDAVNFGSPFVSTSIGAEGLKYTDGIDCFITDHYSDFAARVIQLIENDTIRQKFYDHSAITRDKYYSMDALTQLRFKFYMQILNVK